MSAGAVVSAAVPLTISSRNCEHALGMSWAWARRFAVAHGVPIWRVGERKQLIPAAALLDAIARHAAMQTEQPLTADQELEQARSALAKELAR